MAQKIREVIFSNIAYQDLAEIYNYGLSTFGENLARIFLQNIYQKTDDLPTYFLSYPECRHLKTKTQIYRNIIMGKYLLICRLRPDKIEILRALDGRQKVKTIKSTRKIKTK